MNYYKNNIRHVKGNTYSSGLVSDEELDAVYFTCRDNLNDDGNVLFQKSLGNGITVVEEIDEDETTIYKYAIRIAPADTKDLQAGSYFYDLQIDINHDVFTIMKGKFIIEQDCTREEVINNG